MSLATLLLFFPALFAVFALCDALRRSRAVRHNGWRYLTPGPMFWLSVVCGVGLTAMFTLVSFSQQGTPFIVALAGAFNVMTAVTIFVTLREEVRWNATHLERRTVTGAIRRMAWAELAAHGYEATGYHWVSGHQRPRIRFQSYSNGFPDLMAMVAAHLPHDGPPSEPEAAAMLAPANARR